MTTNLTETTYITDVSLLMLIHGGRMVYTI